ncbi:MAG: hypothetical protein IJY04_02655 [Clostridia bacterium]|nr:hypothetical protein [Clostridia bacterium]
MPANVNEFEFHSMPSAPFKIYGLYLPEDGTPFRRIPEEVAKATSAGVHGLHTNTAGGRIRFETDAEAICVKLKGGHHFMDHMALLGCTGCDLYREDASGNQKYAGSLRFPSTQRGDYVSEKLNLGKGKKYLLINLPLYGNVDELSIGLTPGAFIGEPLPYVHSDRIVFYGSSITQGGCASRPGVCYQNYISRDLKTDYINLGFSGNAKGENAIVEYMAGIENMSAFVSDYDHNAPSPEHLEATHYAMYEKIRAANPDIPYVMITRPNINILVPDSAKRRAIVMESYLKAFNSGDRNVYFIDGYSLFYGGDRDSCTVDGCHPNDLGFQRMGKVIGELLAIALNY